MACPSIACPIARKSTRTTGTQNCIISFSPDGRYLASCSFDTTAKIWSLADNSCKVTLEGHSRQIWWLAWSPDSKHIVTGRQIACAAAAAIVAAWRASGSEDTTARVWNVEYDRC